MYKAKVRNADVFGKIWTFNAESNADSEEETVKELKDYYASSLDNFESEIDVQLLA